MALNGIVIKERLKETFKGESQEVVARKLNMTQGSISKLLTGKQVPTLETLYHVAEMYGVSVDWLIGLSEIRETNSNVNTSYASLVDDISELLCVNGAEILDDYNRFILEIKDPLLESLLKKSISLQKMDREFHSNWKADKLAMFKDKELIDEIIWNDNVIHVLTKGDLSEKAWLSVHEKAEDIKKEYMAF